MTAAGADLVLRPPRHAAFGRGFVLALLAHAALLAALGSGLRWHAGSPPLVSAELWAAVPEVAAPPAPTPTPPPQPAVAPPPSPPVREAPAAREAQISLERAVQARRKADEETRARREMELRDKAEAERRRKDEEQRLARQREDNLRRLLGAAGASGATTSTGTAARDAAPSASYTARIIARIKPNIVVVDEIPGNPMAAVEVRAAPDGTIVARRLLKSSGSKTWDDAVLRAIDRTEVLPRDVDGRVPSLIIIDFRPRD